MWGYLVKVEAHKLLKKYPDLKRVAIQDLARVALRVELGGDQLYLLTKLKSILPDDEREPSPLLKTLAKLPFKLIVTTNYDRLMERALEIFSANDLKDAASLAAKLRDAPTPLCQDLRGQLPPDVRQALDEYDGSPLTKSLQYALLKELNRLLQGDHLKARNPLGQNLKGNALVRFNRSLLEKEFPDEISPCRAYKRVVQPIKGFDGKAQRDLREELTAHEGLIIYKLHGTFHDEKDEAETRPVITEEDYIEFLTFVGGKGEGIPDQIKFEIVDSTLLFLGYGLEDWNFRTIFKSLIEKLPPREQRKSFAIQKDPSDFWVDFWKKKNVEIYNVDLYKFARELERRCEAYEKKESANQGRRGRHV